MKRKLFLGLFVAIAMMSCSKEGTDTLDSGIRPEGKPNEELLYGPIKEYTYSVKDQQGNVGYVKMKFDKNRNKVFQIESESPDFKTYTKKEELIYEGTQLKEEFLYSDNSPEWYNRRVWQGGSYKTYNKYGQITSIKIFYEKGGQFISEYDNSYRDIVSSDKQSRQKNKN